MKKLYSLYNIILLASAFIAITGCKKQDSFLDTKPNQALAVPKTLPDLQLLINNERIFNTSYPSLGEVSTDDYFLDPSYWITLSSTEKNAYVWAKSIYAATTNISDWSDSYQQVYYANTVMNVLTGIKASVSEQSQYNTIKGSALFYRATAFYNLVQTFAMPYDSTSAAKDLGVPLPLTPDLTAKLPRATESQCYTQIIGDLKTALNLLSNVSVSKTHPSKAAVFGLLARIYLVQGNFGQSLENATNCLSLYDQLQDFNKLDPSAFPVYPNFSPEEIFHASFLGYSNIGFQAQVDSTLYRSFDNPNDLRTSIFFYDNSGEIEFNSQFDKLNNLSSTISTNEIYLTKAECEARLNNKAAAMNDLNTLLSTRWLRGTFQSYTATSADDALVQVLKERRKELVFTGLRWSDLRRLNKESRFAVTLYRKINGVIYSLPPNDPKYALPIPDNEIQLNPIPQNNR
jgi:hypothetical protein